MRRLAARPSPVVGESLNGYLLRVGKMNCLFQPSEIFDVLGCYQSTCRYRGWHQTICNDMRLALEKKLERPMDASLNHFELMDNLSWLSALDRIIQDIYYGYPRICPQCIGERGVLDWRWNLAITSTCPKHSAPLISACPKCNKALKWSSNLLIGCYGCEQHWEDIASQPFTLASATEAHIWDTLENDPASMDRALLQDICRALVYVIRPFDMLQEKVRAVPLMADHSAYVARAYRILEDPLFFARWRKQCQVQRSDLLLLGKEFIESPCKLFSKGLIRKWDGPSKGFDVQLNNISDGEALPENTRYISRSRRDMRYELAGGIEYRCQLSISSLSVITGWDEDAANDLFRGDAFPAQNNISQSRQRRFNGRQMISALLDFPDQVTENRIEVRAGSAILRKNLTNMGRLVNAILQKIIPGGFGQEDLLLKVYVDRLRFGNWLINERMCATRRSVTVGDVASALEISEDEIREFVQQGKLKWAIHRDWPKWIDGPALFEFMSKIN
jgi:hypothetical protein